MVPGDVHAIEVRIAIKAFDFLDLESKLLPGGVLGIFIAVSKTNIENTASEAVGRVDKTWGLINRSKGYAPFLKARS